MLLLMRQYFCTSLRQSRHSWARWMEMRWLMSVLRRMQMAWMQSAPKRLVMLLHSQSRFVDMGIITLTDGTARI